MSNRTIPEFEIRVGDVVEYIFNCRRSSTQIKRKAEVVAKIPAGVSKIREIAKKISGKAAVTMDCTDHAYNHGTYLVAWTRPGGRKPRYFRPRIHNILRVTGRVLSQPNLFDKIEPSTLPVNRPDPSWLKKQPQSRTDRLLPLSGKILTVIRNNGSASVLLDGEYVNSSACISADGNGVEYVSIKFA